MPSTRPVSFQEFDNKATGKLQLRWAEGEAKRLGVPNIDISQLNKLFVTNFPRSATEQNFIDLFGNYGEIRVLRVIKHPTNPLKNRCYIKFALKEQAICALKELNEAFKFPDFGKPIEVTFAEGRRIKKKVVQQLEDRIVDNLFDINDFFHKFKAGGQKEEAPPNRESWYLFRTEEGDEYYYSPEQEVSIWEKPEGNVIIYSENEYYETFAVEAMPDPNQEQQFMHSLVLFQGIPDEWEESDIMNFCASYGNVSYARLASEQELSQLGFLTLEKIAILYFGDSASADDFIMQMNGQFLIDKPINLIKIN